MSIEINNLFVYQKNPFDGQNVYKTNIRITIDGLSVFSVCNQSLEYATAYQWAKSNDLQNFSQALKAIKERDAFLNNISENLHLLLEDEAYTLVPQPLFIESELKSYLTHFVEPDKLKNGTPIFFENNQIVAISLLDSVIIEAVRSIFPNTNVKSYTQALLSFSSTIHPKTKDYSLIVSMNSNYFDLVIKKRGQLQFFNRFAFSSKEDFVYFLILTLQNLEIKNTDVEITLLGGVNPQSSITEMLDRYFPEVGFIMPDQDFSWDYHHYCVEQNY